MRGQRESRSETPPMGAVGHRPAPPPPDVERTSIRLETHTTSPTINPASPAGSGRLAHVRDDQTPVRALGHQPRPLPELDPEGQHAFGADLEERGGRLQ